MSSNEYRENHYVPQWYPRRFLPKEGELKFRYLDLKPEKFRDSNGVLRTKKFFHRWGTASCFKETDLYTTRFGNFQSTEIEQFFFGRVDADGLEAVEYFSTFRHPSADGKAFQKLLNYMTVQKLRTPKGLKALRAIIGAPDQNETLFRMQALQSLYGAIWTECVWALVDATECKTKFIISDHPVTLYNRECFPASEMCRDFGDPDIRQVGTHTIFPLSLNRALILTNLSWVRNPYARGTRVRPNPNYFRSAIFNFMEIQTGRQLNEIEINQINFIIKRRAYRYVAAASEEWLYPEEKIPSDHWRKLDENYLLMPDPRSVVFTSNITMGFEKGPPQISDEYGRRPGEPDFEDKNLHKEEWLSHLRFQGEYARIHGPKRRGLNYHLSGKLRDTDDEEFHQHHLDLEKKLAPSAGRRRKRGHH